MYPALWISLLVIYSLVFGCATALFVWRAYWKRFQRLIVREPSLILAQNVFLLFNVIFYCLKSIPVVVSCVTAMWMYCLFDLAVANVFLARVVMLHRRFVIAQNLVATEDEDLPSRSFSYAQKKAEKISERLSKLLNPRRFFFGQALVVVLSLALVIAQTVLGNEIYSRNSLDCIPGWRMLFIYMAAINLLVIVILGVVTWFLFNEADEFGVRRELKYYSVAIPVFYIAINVTAYFVRGDRGAESSRPVSELLMILLMFSFLGLSMLLPVYRTFQDEADNLKQSADEVIVNAAPTSAGKNGGARGDRKIARRKTLAEMDRDARKEVFPTIQETLDHERARKHFRDFLQREMSIQHLMFVESVELLENLCQSAGRDDLDVLCEPVLYVYETYIVSSSENEINISRSEREACTRITMRIQTSDKALLDSITIREVVEPYVAAKLECMKMLRGSFKRFKRRPWYKETRAAQLKRDEAFQRREALRSALEGDAED